MITISDGAAWCPPPELAERIVEELSRAMRPDERPSAWPPRLEAGVDLRAIDATAWHRLQDAAAEAFGFLLAAGPRRFESTESFLATMVELARLRLALAVDPRAGQPPAAAAIEFVLTCAAAELRPERPALALIVMDARPSKGGVATLERLRPDERVTVAGAMLSSRCLVG
ncbi:hypothetical protein ACI782_07960 [Geodermatophilus sp. SYSU D00703]